MDGKVHRIGELLQKYLRESGLDRKLQEAAVPGYWNEIVGSQVSTFTTIKRFEEGQLFVEVPIAVWRHELMLRREDIRMKINQRSGSDIVKEIIIR